MMYKAHKQNQGVHQFCSMVLILDLEFSGTVKSYSQN